MGIITMNITISGKEYELKFGLSFINAMDNLYTQEMSGVQFGMGLEMMNTYLELKRPTALQNVIKAGTSHLKSVPSNEDIETYLEEVFVEGGQEELFEEVKVATEQAPFLRQTVKSLTPKKSEKQATKHTKK